MTRQRTFTAAAAPAKSEPAFFTGVCRLCGCTEADCTGCVERSDDGEPCTWTDATGTLCSACVGKAPDQVRAELAAIPGWTERQQDMALACQAQPSAPRPPCPLCATTCRPGPTDHTWVCPKCCGLVDPPVPAPEASPAPPALQLVSLDRIRPSPSNPRRTFDESGLAELAASIRAKGILQPVVLRPAPGRWTVECGGIMWYACRPIAPDRPGTVRVHMHPTIEEAQSHAGRLNALDGGFELVAGERRVRAARLAGLVEVPAVVRDLTDREVLEVQVIENEQRQDVTPLEKADGYAALVERHQVAVEDLAQRVGKSVSTIRGLLKLRRLPPAAREAVERGELPSQTAGLIAALPSEAMRLKCAGEVLAGERFGPSDEADEPLSYRATKRHIHHRYLVELKQAPFSPKDTALVPGAGACSTCPKRAGNNRSEWPDVRADMCTDPECYEVKQQAWRDRTAAAAREKGQEVMAAALVKKVLPYGHLAYNAPYVELDQPCHDVEHANGKAPTYGSLLKGHIAETDVVLAFDERGELHRLVAREKAAPILKKEHGVGTRPVSTASPAQRTEDAKRRAKAKAGKAAALAANARAAELMRASLAVVDGRLDGLAAMRLRALVIGLVTVCWSDSCRRVAGRRNLAGDDHRQAVLALANQLDDPGALLGLAAELVAAKLSLDWSSEWYGGERDGEKPFWEALGIDRAALVEEAEAAAKKPAARKKVKGPPPDTAGTAAGEERRAGASSPRPRGRKAVSS